MTGFGFRPDHMLQEGYRCCKSCERVMPTVLGFEEYGGGYRRVCRDCRALADEPLERAASALQIAADRIEKFGVRSMRPSDLHDTVTGIVENVAKISGAMVITPYGTIVNRNEE